MFAQRRKSGCRLHASRYLMYLGQSTAGPSSAPKVPAWSVVSSGWSDRGALYFPRAKSMREKLHPGNMAAQSLPSWPALWARVYVRCSSGSKENTLFRGNLQRGRDEASYLLDCKSCIHPPTWQRSNYTSKGRGKSVEVGEEESQIEGSVLALPISSIPPRYYVWNILLKWWGSDSLSGENLPRKFPNSCKSAVTAGDGE